MGLYKLLGREHQACPIQVPRFTSETSQQRCWCFVPVIFAEADLEALFQRLPSAPMNILTVKKGWALKDHRTHRTEDGLLVRCFRYCRMISLYFIDFPWNAMNCTWQFEILGIQGIHCQLWLRAGGFFHVFFGGLEATNGRWNPYGVLKGFSLPIQRWLTSGFISLKSWDLRIIKVVGLPILQQLPLE